MKATSDSQEFEKPREKSKLGGSPPRPVPTWPQTPSPPPLQTGPHRAGARSNLDAGAAVRRSSGPRACPARASRMLTAPSPRCPLCPAALPLSHAARPRRLSRSHALPSPSLCPVVWGRSACHWFLFTDRGFSESQKDPRPHFLKASCPQPAPPAAQGPGGAGAGQAESPLSPGGSARGHRACKHLLPAASPASARHPKVGPDH